jgi:3-phenylpropionate/trans-cinnamate dioxygenase ferredoxin subunit
MKKSIKIFESIKEIHWQSNNMTVIEVDGKKMTIAIFREQLYAFAYKCPHAGGVMAEGFIDSLGNAVCPLHRYKFSLKTGRNSTGEDYLKTYQTEINENGVFIIFEEKRWF